MDDEVMQRVFQEAGRDFYQQQPSTSASSSSSILQSLPLHVSRILVFSAEDRKLKLIAEKITEGPVISLHDFNGKLLAAFSTKIQLYKWFRDLHNESAHDVPDFVTCVQTRGDFIIVAQKGIRMSLLYNHESGAFEEQARHNNSNSLLAPLEFLDDDIYLGADWLFYLFTVRNSEGTEEVIGQYHLGERVSRFEHGSLVMRLPDTDDGQIPTVIFATTCGGIGVIASLPQEQYVLLEKLQLSMNKVIKGVGGSTHEEWRSIIQRNVTPQHFARPRGPSGQGI